MRATSLEKLSLDHNDMIWGEGKEEVSRASASLSERKKLSEWLVTNGLVEAEQPLAPPKERRPALLSPYASVVQQLRAHHQDGLLELRGMDTEELKAHAAFKVLSDGERGALAAVLTRLVREATGHDEL